MTRILDALRKAESTRGDVVHSAPPASTAAPPAAERPACVAVEPPPVMQEARPAIVPFGPSAALPADVVREMTGLRVSLEVALTQRIPRSVMFLASQGGEGTSTVAAQFAQALASDPRLRVLLVDAHARRPAYGSVPAAAQRTHVTRGAPGRAGNPGLDLMPLPEASRLEGLVSSSALRVSLDAVASRYDWIVLDGPPVLESPDAATLGAVADGVLMVVQAGRTKRPVLTRSVDLLRRAGGNVLGIVLNRRRLEIPEFIYRRI